MEAKLGDEVKTAITDPGEICGTCKKYDPDVCYCPLYGEKYEEDTCDDDWEKEE